MYKKVVLLLHCLCCLSLHAMDQLFVQPSFVSDVMVCDQQKMLQDQKRSYRCWYRGCPLDFGDAYTCQNHYVRDHISLKTFGCEACEARYAVYEDLMDHMSTAHTINNSDVAIRLANENLAGWLCVQDKLIVSLMNARSRGIHVTTFFQQEAQPTLVVPELPAALRSYDECESESEDERRVQVLAPEPSDQKVVPSDSIIEQSNPKSFKKKEITLTKKIPCPYPGCNSSSHVGNIHRHYRNTHYIADRDARKAFSCLFGKCSGKYPDLYAIKQHLCNTHKVKKEQEHSFIHKNEALWNKIQAKVSAKIATRVSQLLSSDVPKEYACSVCKKSFDLPTRLNRHFTIVHMPKTFECPKCKKYATNDSDVLKKHYRNHLIREDPSLAPFSCPEKQCNNKTFLTVRRYAEHVRAIHPNKVLDDQELDDKGKREALNLLAKKDLNIGDPGHKRQKIA